MFASGKTGSAEQEFLRDHRAVDIHGLCQNSVDIHLGSAKVGIVLPIPLNRSTSKRKRDRSVCVRRISGCAVEERGATIVMPSSGVDERCIPVIYKVICQLGRFTSVLIDIDLGCRAKTRQRQR